MYKVSISFFISRSFAISSKFLFSHIINFMISFSYDSKVLFFVGWSSSLLDFIVIASLFIAASLFYCFIWFKFFFIVIIYACVIPYFSNSCLYSLHQILFLNSIITPPSICNMSTSSFLILSTNSFYFPFSKTNFLALSVFQFIGLLYY
jgi:hypothetical protein